ncbi:MAG: cyanophycin synthetase [Euryarchaeota archaeon]|nr:cyanophycin synthetase [Euryarchaeota archaeon]
MGLEVRRIRALEGANVFALFPVIYGEVKLNEFYNISSSDVPGFTESITTLFPGLQNHKCSYGVKGGFIKRLKEGTYLPHISEHLCIELQNILGIPVKFGKSIWIDDDIYWVAVEYVYKDTGTLALKYSFEIVEKLLSGKTISHEEVQTYLHDLKKVLDEEKLGPSTQAIINSAKKRKIPIIPIDLRWSMFQLGYGKKAVKISATITSKTSLLAGDIAKDKYMTKKILERMGIHVPRGYVVSNLDSALDAAHKIGFPVVIKPLDSHHGKGVISDIKEDREVKLAFLVASKYSRKVMIEEHLTGDDYRFLVINGKVVAASKRIPPYIIGDGKSTIKELVDKLNSDPLRGEGHENYLTRVKLEEEEISYLRHQGFTPSDVLPSGIKVYLRKNGNLSTGGIAIDVTEEVHLEIINEVERAAKTVGLDVCGVDAIIKDIKRPLGNRNGGIIEINAAPGLRMHLRPTEGKKRNVADAIVDYLFPKNDDGRIPVIAVTGTNGKTSVVKLLGKILSKEGYKVGMSTTGGIYINDKKIISGDTTGPWSTRIILQNPDVEVAVLEVARGGIWRRGLGYDRAFIGCVLNIREDHLGVDGIKSKEDIFWIKSLVTEAVLPSGFSVLNAEDEYCEKLMARAKGKPALFSTKYNENIKNALEKQYPVIYVENNRVLFANGKTSEEIIPVKSINYAMGGKIKAHLENALAAILIAKLMGVPTKTIKEVLKDTSISEFDGRMNIINFENKTVIIDYAHNPDAILHLKDFVQILNPQESWCVVAIPGDRNNDILKKDGKALGKVFDHVIVTARESDLRGRDKDDLLNRIADGADETDCKEVRKIGECKAALRYALNNAKSGDAIFILLGLSGPEELSDILGSVFNST